MERASRVMGKLRFPDDAVTGEELARAAWNSAVGPRIARHARAERLVRGKLIVGVDDSVWQRQLFVMSRLILEKLGGTLGEGRVTDLEFRVAPPKRAPRRAEASRPADEADSILDPGLRRVYLASRKRELA
ncbi:MAG: DUF721 domain-containing protein [Acidobacteria bacterium]|nr:DUF721 domain-containing protein [Acidobacteriota bacterium]MBI3470223.1 DUF721 domain-containing protein [Candidatus Solibacter usitatus]